VGQPTLSRQLRMGMFAALDQPHRHPLHHQGDGHRPSPPPTCVITIGPGRTRKEPLFADDAIARLHRVSNGLPRALNKRGDRRPHWPARPSAKELVDERLRQEGRAELTKD